jgi:hypothetical protein
MVIFSMRLEMTGQIIDARSQQGDLNFRRTGISGCTLVILNNLGLLGSRNTHLVTLQQKKRILLAQG